MLGERYLVYGEWAYAKHTIAYDRLPHYFLAFDMLDKSTGDFLSTQRRQAILAESPIVSVPAIVGPIPTSPETLAGLIGRSTYKSTAWRAWLHGLALDHGQAPERVMAETDPSDHMEGLYLKIETPDWVVDRYKFVRPDFHAAVTESGSHWQTRPILPNALMPGVDIFAGT